jgi:predicted amidohydrolase YtcJ
VYLSRADGHAGVANTVALRLAAITRETDPPPGGEIVRDEHGEPTGMLVDRAHELMLARIPLPHESELERRLEVAADRIVRLGWTQIQDPGYLDAGGSWDQIERLRRLYVTRRIRLRIYKGVYGPGPAADSLLRRGPSVGEFGGRLTVRALKVVLDGALGSRGALLLRAYADAPGSTGRLIADTASLAPMLRGALRRGLQVQAHAVGDGANRLLLDLYRDAFAAVPERARAIREPRWRAEHAQVISPADIGRFQQLGVIPSMQPSHAIGDLHFAPARLGRERLAGAYAWRSLLATGVPIAGGSDAPLERGEPMIEFYAAVSRRDTAGFQGAGWHPEQVATRQEALKMFTLWAAYAAFEEDRRGTIEPGKWADLTVLSADIMRIPERDILRTRAVMTVIGGEVVYER